MALPSTKTELEKLESRNYYLMRRIERSEEVLDLVVFLSDTFDEKTRASIKDAFVKYNDKYLNRF